MLSAGTKLLAAYWPSLNGDPAVCEVVVGDRAWDAKSITVVEEYGQMAKVPWAHAVMNDGTEQMWNLAHAEGVKLEVRDD